MFLLVLVAVFSLAGCGENSKPIQGEQTEAASALAFRKAGDAALGQDRFEDARDAYQQAIARSPRDAGLYYRLGVTLSHLGSVSEAERAFERVLVLAQNQGQEAEAARKWLMARGLVPHVRSTETQADPESVSGTVEESGTANAVDAQHSEGVLSGQVSWRLHDGRIEIIAGRSVELYDLDRPGKRLAWQVTDKEGRFRFEGLSAGTYRLRAFYAGPTPLWSVAVRVNPDQETTIALTKENSTANGGDFSKKDR